MSFMEIWKNRLSYLLNEITSIREGLTKSLKTLWLISFVIEYNTLKGKCNGQVRFVKKLSLRKGTQSKLSHTHYKTVLNSKKQQKTIPRQVTILGTIRNKNVGLRTPCLVKYLYDNGVRNSSCYEMLWL